MIPTKNDGVEGAGGADEGSSNEVVSEDGRPKSSPPSSTHAVDAVCAPPTALKRFVTDTTQGINRIVKAPFEQMHERWQLPHEGNRRKYQSPPYDAADGAGKRCAPAKEPNVAQQGGGGMAQKDGGTAREEEDGVQRKDEGGTAQKKDDASGQDRARAIAAADATTDGERLDVNPPANPPATRVKPAKSGGSTRSVIVLPPIVEFLVRDSTVLAVAGIVASFLTHRHWSEIHDGGALPFSTAAAWMIVAYFLGHRRTVENDAFFAMEVQVAEERALQAVMEREQAALKKEEEAIDEEDLERMVGKANASIVVELRKEEATTTGATTEASPRKQKRRRMLRPDIQRAADRKWHRRAPRSRIVRQATAARRHSVFVIAMEAVTNKKIVFEGEVEPRIREEDLPPGFWTTLLEMPSREPEDWELHSDDISDKLMARLLKDPGNYSRAQVAGEEIIEPMCTFRGIDAFLPDGSDNELSKRKILIDCGLRDKPMGMIHVMCPFASLVSYFELPSWVEEDGGLEEKEDDPDDVKAVKRFIKGDAEYRNKRLKIYPVLREGPMAVRMLFYPPSKEFCIWGTMLPIIYHDQKPTAAPDGQKNSLVIEACVDVVSNRLARSTAQLMGSSLKNIDIDIAVVIGTPDHQKEKEPEACIGYFRYDHIDLKTCSQLPPKSNTESIMEASTVRSSLEQVSVAA